MSVLPDQCETSTDDASSIKSPSTPISQYSTSDYGGDKILIANRGEICIRICRAARELSIPTIAIYAYEDRNSNHYRSRSLSYPLSLSMKQLCSHEKR